jgi:hypothetical protein
MRTLSKHPAPCPIITRQFEFSRHQGINLASAFEQALPIIRRTFGQPPLPRAAADRPYFHRRASS